MYHLVGRGLWGQIILWRWPCMMQNVIHSTNTIGWRDILNIIIFDFDNIKPLYLLISSTNTVFAWLFYPSTCGISFMSVRLKFLHFSICYYKLYIYFVNGIINIYRGPKVIMDICIEHCPNKWNKQALKPFKYSLVHKIIARFGPRERVNVRTKMLNRWEGNQNKPYTYSLQAIIIQIPSRQNLSELLDLWRNH